MKTLKSSITALASMAFLIMATPVQADSILMDFGSEAAGWNTTGQPLTWNNITSSGGFIQGANNVTNSGATLALLNTNGAASGITLTVVRSFAYANANGPTTTTTGYPGTATEDSLYGQVQAFANGNGITTANVYPALNFSGFNPFRAYSFKFYASRGTIGDNRETRYTLAGATTNSVLYQPANNVNTTTNINNFLPDASGNILYNQAPGPNNTSANHFSYIGVMQIDLVPQKATTVSVSSSANPINYGNSVIFTATVQTNAVTAGNAAGNVIFKVNGLAFDTNALSSGSAKATNSFMLGGNNVITAEYAGDSLYQAGTNNLAGGQVVTLTGTTPTITSLPTASAISYGQMLASSTLSGGEATNETDGVSVAGFFVFTTGAITPNAGSTNVSITFMPTTAGYNPVSSNLTVSVNQTTPGLTAPKASPLTFSQTLAGSILIGGAATNGFNNAAVAGSFAFTTPSLLPNATGTTNVSVIFTPTDTANYNSATTTVTASVTKKIVVLGSSVALGFGSSPSVFYNGSYTNGYAGLLTAFLAPGGWTVTNISIGGQITANGLSRFSQELVPQAPNYVLIGYSLANEGLVGATDPNSLLNTFTANLANLVGQCRSNGFYPIVTLCYPNNGYSLAE